MRTTGDGQEGEEEETEAERAFSPLSTFFKSVYLVMQLSIVEPSRKSIMVLQTAVLVMQHVLIFFIPSHQRTRLPTRIHPSTRSTNNTTDNAGHAVLHVDAGIMTTMMKKKKVCFCCVCVCVCFWLNCFATRFTQHNETSRKFPVLSFVIIVFIMGPSAK